MNNRFRVRRKLSSWGAQGALLCCVWIVSSCDSTNDPNVDILDRTLEDRRLVKDLIPNPDLPTIVLVEDGRNCLNCNIRFPTYEQYDQKGRLNLVLIMGGQFSDGDLRALKIRRIPVAGVLKSRSDFTDRIPSEYLVYQGRVLDKAEGRLAVYAKEFWKHPLIVGDTSRNNAVPRTDIAPSLRSSTPTRG
jgi:hypothetical protein